MRSSLATDSCFCKQLKRVSGSSRLQLMMADQKALFSQRLNKVCDEASLPMRGRRAMLAQLTGVSGESARKWLSREAIPAMPHVAALATHFGSSAQWLLTGQDDASNDGILTLTNEETQLILALRRLPSNERATAWRVISALLTPPQISNEQLIPSRPLPASTPGAARPPCSSRSPPRLSLPDPRLFQEAPGPTAPRA